MRNYGRWKANENLELCIVSVSEPGRYGSFYPHQCTRKRGHGKDGLYCKQHAKKYPQGDPYMHEEK